MFVSLIHPDRHRTYTVKENGRFVLSVQFLAEFPGYVIVKYWHTEGRAYRKPAGVARDLLVDWLATREGGLPTEVRAFGQRPRKPVKAPSVPVEARDPHVQSVHTPGHADSLVGMSRWELRDALEAARKQLSDADDTISELFETVRQLREQNERQMAIIERVRQEVTA